MGTTVRRAGSGARILAGSRSVLGPLWAGLVIQVEAKAAQGRTAQLTGGQQDRDCARSEGQMLASGTVSGTIYDMDAFVISPKVKPGCQ